MKEAWGDKTPEKITPPIKNHTVYFGSNKSERLYDKTYSAATQNSIPPSVSEQQIEASKTENDNLRKAIDDLRKKFDTLEKKQTNSELNLKQKLKEELTLEFGTMISELKKEISGTMEKCQNIATKMETSIQGFERNLISREERIKTQNLQDIRTVMLELFPKTVTPSEDDQTSMIVLRGGAQ